MRIIHVLAGKIWGGAELYAINLGREQQKNGHQVKYYACDVPIVHESMPIDIDPCYINFKGAFDKDSAKILAQDIKDMGTEDIIHIHGTNFVYWAMNARKIAKSNVKTVLTRHTSRATFINPLFWSSFRKLHKIIFVSNCSMRTWLSSNFWMDKSKCTAILNSVNETNLTNEETVDLRKKYGISNDTALIVFVGRLVKYKGCEVILKALSKITNKPYAFVFVGNGKNEYVQRLTKIAEELGIKDQIHFSGFSSNIPSIINQCDFGVAPSIVKEGCHLVPMEFMKYGKAIITTNNGGQVEFVTDRKTGLLVPPNDIDSLSNAIQILLDDTKLRDDIAQNAKIYFQKHLRYDSFLSNIHKCYE